MDKSFLEKLDRKNRPGRNSQLLFLVLGLFCVLFVIWASVGRLDIVSRAQGQVVPSTRVRTVQHLEGGIVREILIREGQVVSAGQPLIVLEQIVSDAFFEEVQSRIISLRLDLARLEALSQDMDEPDFPDELKQSHPQLVARSRSHFMALKDSYVSNIFSQQELIRQREHQVREIMTRRKNARENLELLQEQIALSQELLEENLTTRYKHLSYLREEAALKSRIEEDGAALEAARAALSEARANLNKIRTAHLKDIQNQLKKTRQELEEIQQRQRRHADSLDRTVLRSPVEGVVKTLHVSTVGGVIRSGMDVVEIVPAGDKLVIEAMLPVGDIGYVQEDQAATVRLASRESVIFGKLEGRVIHVAPDTTVTPEGGAYYAVRIQTEKDRFENNGMEYRLYPGMIMQVAIHTGSRTVLQYILDPLMGTMSGVLQER
ncbi:MAG: HlyD family type I secretion periplasmic adaptor subunit [Desulfonatronovibrio sp.]